MKIKVLLTGMIMKRYLTIAGFVVVLLGLSYFGFAGKGAGGDREGSDKFISDYKPTQGEVVVNIKPEGGFYPEKITIKKGARVVWVNKSAKFSWPASDFHPVHNIYPEFDPKEPIASGEAWAFNFDKAGLWAYHDHLAPYFTGEVNVEE